MAKRPTNKRKTRLTAAQKKALAAKKAAQKKALATESAVPILRHNTDRYDWLGHGKNDLATRTTGKRYDIEDSYPCNVSDLDSRAKLRNAARHAFAGRLIINGLKIPATRNDGTLANAIAKLSGTTRVNVKPGTVFRKRACRIVKK